MKLRGLIAGLAAVTAIFGGLMAVPVPAEAGSTTTAVTQRRSTPPNYGSGVWTGTTSPVVRSGDPVTADVLLVGDSIGQRCTADTRTALAAEGKSLATITQSSQNAEGLVTLLLAEPTVPTKVYLEAGTNSVFNPPEMAAQIARVQNWAADNGVTIYWGDTYVGRPATPTADARNSGWVNAFIYSAVPYDHVIKWQAAIAAAVGRGGGASPGMLEYYIQDGVHPWSNAGTGHGDGCAFFGAVVAGGIA